MTAPLTLWGPRWAFPTAPRAELSLLARAPWAERRPEASPLPARTGKPLLGLHGASCASVLRNPEKKPAVRVLASVWSRALGQTCLWKKDQEKCGGGRRPGAHSPHVTDSLKNAKQHANLSQTLSSVQVGTTTVLVRSHTESFRNLHRPDRPSGADSPRQPHSSL